VATLDHDAELVVSRTVAFVRDVLGSGSTSAQSAAGSAG
jgi:hypothetical protein